MNLCETLAKNRNDAKVANQQYYFTGKPCKNNHIAKRQTANGTCIECNRVYAMNHYTNNSASRIKLVKNYQSKNPDKVKRWSKQNYINNKAAFCNRAMMRHAAKLKRTPMWLSDSDKREIKLIYKIAARVSKETGIVHHVDHEIPLQGEFVSGLHVPGNLQLLTAFDNCSKHNKFDTGNM